MPIEFSCPSCQAKIRTPDNTAGKSARCPKCSTVITIPSPSGAGSPPPGFSQPPAQWPPANPLGAPLGAPAGNPLGAPPPGASPNPFGDRQAGSFGPAPVNPYAAPNPIGAYGQYKPPAISREAVRPKLLGPAIGLTLFSVLGLGFMSMVALGMAIDPDAILDEAPQDPAEQAGFYGFFFVYFIGGLLTRLIQIAGAIALFRVRWYGVAMAGLICALLPCDVYCCIFCLPFGIWGLIVLNNPQVKAAFQLP